MSILTSKFDIQSVETPLAVAAVAQVLDVNVGAVSGLYSGTSSANDFSGGTPQVGATSIPPGAIVKMNASGQAVLADAPILWTHDASDTGNANLMTRDFRVSTILPFVVIDGNTDFAGRFVRKVTALHGGMTISTDQYSTDANLGQGSADVQTFAVGAPVSFLQGKIVPALGASLARQSIGFVGPAGLDTVNGVLQVIIPQGSGL